MKVKVMNTNSRDTTKNVNTSNVSTKTTNTEFKVENGVDKKTVIKDLVRKRKGDKNVGDGVFLGYPLLVIFDDSTGDFIFMDSASTAYTGLYDPGTYETVFEWPSGYTPGSGQYYLLHRFDTFFLVDRPEIQEESFVTTPYRLMTAIDVSSMEVRSKLRYPEPQSSSSLTSPSRPKYDVESRGKFRKPISPKKWAKRVGDDIPTTVFGVFEISSPYRHVYSTTSMLFNIDVEHYHQSVSPLAWTQYDNFCAVDVESYTEYYCWTVQVVADCTIGNPITFLITSTISPPLRSSYPLGMQLQANIPNEAIHHGIRCSGCNKPSISGVRYQCCVCEDFNLCSKCESAQVQPLTHSVDHQLLKIKVPIVPRTVHTGVACDTCGVSPIEGIRYKCQLCDDFDLCEKCESTTDHPANHPLIKAKQQLLLLK